MTVLPGGGSFTRARLCLSQISNCMRTKGLRVLRQSLHLALGALHMLASAAWAIFKSRAALHWENLALRRRLGVLHRPVKRPKLTTTDRLVWAWLSAAWAGWRSALARVKPGTVIARHRRGFRPFGRWKIWRGQPGRPAVLKVVRELIRRMSCENPPWSEPRIHGELLKPRTGVGETSVGKYVGTRTRCCHAASWRSSPPIRPARSLNVVGLRPGPSRDKRASTWAGLRSAPPCARQWRTWGAGSRAKQAAGVAMLACHLPSRRDQFAPARALPHTGAARGTVKPPSALPYTWL